MKRISSICLLAAVLFLSAFQNPEKKPVAISSESAADARVKIKIAGDKSVWDAHIGSAQAVFDSAAVELVQHFPNRKIDPIILHPKGGPIVFYQRGDRGEFTVKLKTGGRFWSQYAYQFSHELTHILSNYRKDENPNGWFEESLCELASLFTLRSMAKTWAEKPPFPNWKSYAPSLADYAQNRIDSANLLAREPLAKWLKKNEPGLRQSATQRELNNIVAVKLLPLFEQNPAGWEAISWINVEPSFADDTLADFLRRWHFYVPDRHKNFVKKIAAECGIRLK